MRVPICSALILWLSLLIGCNNSSQPANDSKPSASNTVGTLTNFHATDDARQDSSIVEEPTNGVVELRTAEVRKGQGLLADEVKLSDQVGTWQTEAFHESIKTRLKMLGEVIATKNWGMNGRELILPQFTCSALRPGANQMEQAFRDENLTVFRPAKTFQSEGAHTGPTGLVDALRQLTKPFDGTSVIEFNFKVYRVNLDGETAESEMYVDADGIGQVGGVQQNMVWVCQWRCVADNDWRLSSIRLAQFEEVHYARSGAEKLFSDCTESALSENASFSAHLRYGVDHWRLRIEERLGIDSVSLAGLAIGDVNGDGLDDCYACEVGGLPNRLFIQNPNGTARDVSMDAGVDWLDRSYGALFADLDNDGDQDLIVSASVSLLLMANDGSGRFELRARLEPYPTAHSLTAADYDGDGRLDLYVCSYGDSFETFADSKTPLPWHDANNGAPNTLYRNEANWSFRSVTAEVGLEENNRRYSYSASWEDCDNDGDQDLYVANDFGRNNLYLNDVNQTGRFRDVASVFGVEDIAPGMSVDWGDYDNDGSMDLYISNMFSSAGNRITFQDRFMTGSAAELIGSYRRFARGNTLFRHRDRRGFEDVSLRAGVTMGRWAWSSLFADINNDGWQDLLVANGHVSGVQPDDL